MSTGKGSSYWDKNRNLSRGDKKRPEMSVSKTQKGRTEGQASAKRDGVVY